MCAELCPALCNPMDSSLPGSSVCGICQARILEWVAISFSRGSFQLRGRTYITCVPCISRHFLYMRNPFDILFLAKGLSRVFSRNKFEGISSSAFSLLYSPTLTSIHDYWKNHSFDYTDLCRQCLCVLIEVIWPNILKIKIFRDFLSLLFILGNLVEDQLIVYSWV